MHHIRTRKYGGELCAGIEQEILFPVSVKVHVYLMFLYFSVKCTQVHAQELCGCGHVAAAFFECGNDQCGFVLGDVV